jgi:hypothetical protein
VSLTKKAAALVNQMESATVDNVLPHLPGYTRTQVRRALKAALDQGLIDSDDRLRQESRPHRATGKPRGAMPTTYRAIKKQYRPVASVWHFAQLQAA